MKIGSPETGALVQTHFCLGGIISNILYEEPSGK